MADTLDALREYLEQIGFQQIYKFMVSVSQYMVAPSMVTRNSAKDTALFFDTVLKGRDDLLLAQCLLLGRLATKEALGEYLHLAEALVKAGLLSESDNGQEIGPANRQLIAAFGLNLLIDRRIHFGSEIHKVYIGPDSFWMLYYLNSASIKKGHKALDLCTGTGIAALYMATFSDNVIGTDIDSEAIELAHINRRLNDCETKLEVRNENLYDTLDGRERFDLLTCNPPFIAFPPGVDATTYAHGTEADGLGYMRHIIDRLPDVMTPGGSAYLVADIVGDDMAPHFITELESFASSHHLAIDVYIDSKISADAQVSSLSPYLQRLNPNRTVDSIAADFQQFQKDVLKAEQYYLSTVKLSTEATNSGVRVMNRFARPVVHS